MTRPFDLEANFRCGHSNDGIFAADKPEQCQCSVERRQFLIINTTKKVA